jgi:preprotein translocase subunit SecY
LATNPQLAKSAAAGFPWNRLWFLLGALVVYRIGAHIPVPGIDPVQLAALFKSQEGGILGMLNMFSGGALARFTVFALGITPYISASIIMQLVSIVSPQMEALKKEGESGRRKITQYTRYFTVVLALFQALSIAVALESQAGLVLDPGYAFRFVTVVTLLTGTMFVMSKLPSAVSATASRSSFSRASRPACRARWVVWARRSATVRSAPSRRSSS